MEDNAPILVRIFKEESVLEVWKQEEASSRYALLKTYDICKWSGEPRAEEGGGRPPGAGGLLYDHPGADEPELRLLPLFNIGYPNAYDRSLGRTGAHLMVHGACSSRGCYSMNDEQIQEIYTLGAARLPGRPARLPGAGLPVPHDAREHGAAPQRSELARSGRC